MWFEMNGKQVWIDETGGKKGGLIRGNQLTVKRVYTDGEMGPAPQGAWWGKLIPALIFFGIVAYVLYKLATMQP